VQALWSSHAPGSSGKKQPNRGSHEFAVQRLPSSQDRGLPRHAPAKQASFEVHAFSSSHAFPDEGIPAHVPPAHRSLDVHAFPSSQVAVLKL